MGIYGCTQAPLPVRHRLVVICRSLILRARSCTKGTKCAYGLPLLSSLNLLKSQLLWHVIGSEPCDSETMLCPGPNPSSFLEHAANSTVPKILLRTSCGLGKLRARMVPGARHARYCRGLTFESLMNARYALKLQASLFRRGEAEASLCEKRRS